MTYGQQLHQVSFKEVATYIRLLGIRRRARHIRQLDNSAPLLSWGDVEAPCVFLLGGVHGDEPSGSLALVQLLELVDLTRWCTDNALSLRVLPILNDEGWDTQTRRWRGIDLNRSFLDSPHTPYIVDQLLEEFREQPPTMFVDFHEDDTQPGPYLFRHVDDDPAFVSAMAEYLSADVETWETSHEWEGASEMPVRKLGAKFVTTVEHPGTYSQDVAVAWQYSAVEWVMQHAAAFIHG